MRSIFGLGSGFVQDALVMVVHGNGQGLFRSLLSDAVLVQLGLDLGGLFDGQLWRFSLGGFLGQFLVEHLFEGIDAFVAYVHAWAGHQLADFGMRFAAEAAQGEITRAGHGKAGYFSSTEDLSGSVVTSLREDTTSSTKPKSLASSAVRKLSRSQAS